jgi:hypothetical protein
VHTDSPETSVAVVADPQPSNGMRRRLLGAGLIGLAGSLVPRLAASAGAASTPDTTAGTTANTTAGTATADTTAATTTTTPPRRPTSSDVDVMGFAQSFELAVAQLYAAALGSGALSDATLAVVTNVHQAHVSYGQSLNAFLGRDAPGQALADVLDSFGNDFAGDEKTFLAAAYQVEDTAVATHTELAGQLVGTDGVELIASILIAEARHSLVFADLAGITDLDALLLTNADALQPGKG